MGRKKTRKGSPWSGTGGEKGKQRKKGHEVCVMRERGGVRGNPNGEGN